MAVEVISLAELRDRMKAQGVPPEHVAFKCVICGTVQSPRSFLLAGATQEQADLSAGFSCIGRFTKAPEWDSRDPARRVIPGCNWSLGGLFRLHKLAVRMEGGERPAFELASPEEAQALMKRGGMPEGPPPLPLLVVGAKVMYRASRGHEYEAIVTDIPSEGQGRTTSETRTVSLEYRDSRRKLNRLSRVLHWTRSTNRRQVWWMDPAPRSEDAAAPQGDSPR